MIQLKENEGEVPVDTDNEAQPRISSNRKYMIYIIYRQSAYTRSKEDKNKNVG